MIFNTSPLKMDVLINFIKEKDLNFKSFDRVGIQAQEKDAGCGLQYCHWKDDTEMRKLWLELCLRLKIRNLSENRGNFIEVWNTIEKYYGILASHVDDVEESDGISGIEALKTRTGLQKYACGGLIFYTVLAR